VIRTVTRTSILCAAGLCLLSMPALGQDPKGEGAPAPDDGYQQAELPKLAGSGKLIIEPNPPARGKEARLIYDATGSGLADKPSVKIHLGRNEWSHVDMPSMTKGADGKWGYTFTVDGAARVLNIALNDGGEVWDNNGGENWNFPTVSSGDSRVTLDPLVPMQGKELKIVYSPAGSPLDGKEPILLHMGRNGWKEVLDPRPQLTKTADNKWEHTLKVPEDAAVLNFVFTDGKESWDNNDGADWHIDVVTKGYMRVTFEPNPPAAGQPAIIRYDATGTPLEGKELVVIQLGKNKWQEIEMLTMTSKGKNIWELATTIDIKAKQLDFVFTDGEDAWDNNGEADWHVPTAGAAAK